MIMEQKNYNFYNYSLKFLISLVILYSFSYLVIAEFDIDSEFLRLRYSLSKTFKEERTQLHLLSFIQNPAVLYKTSVMDEEEGKLKEAVRDMELAIGLLEMHGASSSVIARYNERLLKLQNKLTGK